MNTEQEELGLGFQKYKYGLILFSNMDWVDNGCRAA